MLDLKQVTIKVKKGHVHLYTGVVVEEKVCKLPLSVVPLIQWEESVKMTLINELIRKDELTTVLALSGMLAEEMVAEPRETKPAGWQENKPST